MLATLIPDWFWTFGISAFLDNAAQVITWAFDWMVGLLMGIFNVPVTWALGLLGLPAHVPSAVLDLWACLLAWVDIFVSYSVVLTALHVTFGFMTWALWIRVAVFCWKHMMPIVVHIFNFLKFW